MNPKRFGLFLVVAAFAACSEGIEGPPERPPTISESYYALAIHFNQGSIGGIKAFYSRSFKHGCLGTGSLDSLWGYRMSGGAVKINQVALLECTGDTLLQCILEVHYRRDGVLDTIRLEPGGDHDDVCYWLREEDIWKLYGNQQPCGDHR